MSNKKIFLLIAALVFITMNSFLFITAPPPLEEDTEAELYTFSVQDGFKVLARLNDEYRTLYTKKIVGGGKKVGLKFDEDWKKDEVEAGPLPALFLRETSAFIEKSTVPLGLYLGSDFPISESNLFTGIQAEKFQEIKKDKKPKFFYNKDTESYIGMFPDVASAAACVSCHNEHENSPKKDWELNDMMGATTWSFGRDSLTTNELIEWIDVFNAGAKNTYSTYLDKTQAFAHLDKPEIGEKWPQEGYFLPSATALSDTVLNKVSLFLINNFIHENK